VSLTCQRAASYWDRYYRNQFPDRRDYPNLALLTSIHTAGSDFAAARRSTS
jgi:hypothetical protein